MRGSRIAVMHDFFVDRIIKLKSKEHLFDAISSKTASGGGSVRGFPTFDVKGGNATNVAYCLANFGLKVDLFTIADRFGSSLLREVFSRFGDLASLHIGEGKHGCTTSFEFSENLTNVNVMISDIGDIANFGPDKVSENINIINQCSAVVVLNWSSNLKGTDLMRYVFENSPGALRFVDPADFEKRTGEFVHSMTSLADIVDVISINENECNLVGSEIGRGRLVVNHSPDEVMSASKIISARIGVNVDLHTTAGSAWSDGKDSFFFPSLKVTPQIFTGAGDVWDAADVLGYIAGLDFYSRLMFANTCAALYVRTKDGIPPTLEQVNDFINLK